MTSSLPAGGLYISAKPPVMSWSGQITWTVVVSAAALVVSIVSTCVAVKAAKRLERSEAFRLRITLDGYALIREQLLPGAAYLVVGLIIENLARLPVAVTAASFVFGNVRYNFWLRPVRLIERNQNNPGLPEEYVFLDSDQLPANLGPMEARLLMLVCGVPQSFAALRAIPLSIRFQTTRGQVTETLRLSFEPIRVPSRYLNKRCPPLRKLGVHRVPPKP